MNLFRKGKNTNDSGLRTRVPFDEWIPWDIPNEIRRKYYPNAIVTKLLKGLGDGAFNALFPSLSLNLSISSTASFAIDIVGEPHWDSETEEIVVAVLQNEVSNYRMTQQMFMLQSKSKIDFALSRLEANATFLETLKSLMPIIQSP